MSMKLSVRAHTLIMPLTLLPLLTTLPVHAAANATTATPAAATKPPALKAGQNNLNWLFRYRAEYVDQDGLPEQALANTLLTRLSAQQGISDSWSAGVEFDYVAALDNSRYNNSFNGKSRYPLIADPTGSDLNQAYVQYQHGGHQLKIGRQKLALGNERFVGGVSWRQNEQTFDALRYQTALGSGSSFDSGLSLDYSFSNRVNRVFGSKSPQGDWRGNIHLLDVNYAISTAQQLKFYGYDMDFREAPAQSNRTLGLDYQHSGKAGALNWQWAGALATQQDSGDNPRSYRASYQNLEAQLSYQAYLFGAGYEKLGSDNGVGFSTPLATLHKFQGYADKFLTTPANGVKDLQLKAGYIKPDWDLQLQYHWLTAATGGADYGHELNVSLQLKFGPRYVVLVKAAQYDARHYLTDTNKYWLQWLARY
ncbi:MAG: hypothetical protein E6Q75_14695 [Rheinheimera sp.]|nr:MAG: hypothetical protein E6Q75_14695 [Rheinheimera sp.]